MKLILFDLIIISILYEHEIESLYGSIILPTKNHNPSRYFKIIITILRVVFCSLFNHFATRHEHTNDAADCCWLPYQITLLSGTFMHTRRNLFTPFKSERTKNQSPDACWKRGSPLLYTLETDLFVAQRAHTLSLSGTGSSTQVGIFLCPDRTTDRPIDNVSRD